MRTEVGRRLFPGIYGKPDRGGSKQDRRGRFVDIPNVGRIYIKPSGEQVGVPFIEGAEGREYFYAGLDISDPGETAPPIAPDVAGLELPGQASGVVEGLRGRTVEPVEGLRGRLPSEVVPPRPVRPPRAPVQDVVSSIVGEPVPLPEGGPPTGPVRGPIPPTAPRNSGTAPVVPIPPRAPAPDRSPSINGPAPRQGSTFGDLLAMLGDAPPDKTVSVSDKLVFPNPNFVAPRAPVRGGALAPKPIPPRVSFSDVVAPEARRGSRTARPQ